jgi:hypothetical protein
MVQVDASDLREEQQVHTPLQMMQLQMRLFTIAAADDTCAKRELGRINKLHIQAVPAWPSWRRNLSMRMRPIG